MTFRRFTHSPQDTCTCHPDLPWEHWANQGNVTEPVWYNSLLEAASTWCGKLRTTTMHINCEPVVTYAEAEECRRHIKVGKAAGPDGIPSDVVHNLPALTVVMHLLFSVMLRFGVYPLAWGVGLVRAILKPGKPKNMASSLRGIRLLSSFASWFGRVYDGRARKAWSPGPEQFGFRAGMGCSEAVILLIALICSRTLQKNRLFVLWVDLRTAFPSLSRPILVQKMFRCGLGLGLCRMMLAMPDLTQGIVCIGAMVGRPFRETLGVREGAVESPHAFNMYVNDRRAQLEAVHPRLCQLMGITIAILLYADDAALPADTEEDLQIAATIFEEFCNTNRLFISTPKTFVTVFHNVSDDGVQYSNEDVYVDGRLVRIPVYSQNIAAAREFKYLGVVLDSTCSGAAHFAARSGAVDRSAHLLLSGLSRVPSYPHRMLSYLWSCLVAPVGSYGMELFAHSAGEAQAFEDKERKWWRRPQKLRFKSKFKQQICTEHLPKTPILEVAATDWASAFRVSLASGSGRPPSVATTTEIEIYKKTL